MRLASASIHRGEEPPVTGQGGSGTIFVSGCNLGCAFCQNHQISKGPVALGRLAGLEEFARICLTLEERGAENINIVTGSHAVPALAAGLDAAQTSGLTVPVLWNSSAYEYAETLELLRGRVAGWLPDLKTLDSGLAARFFCAPDYPEIAHTAILKMLDLSSAAPRPGWPAAPCIIRHLVLPGFLESTRSVLRWFAEYAAGRARISLMTQYTPVESGYTPEGSIPDRQVEQDEYKTILRWLEEFNIDDGYYQELTPGGDWIPDFSRQNPFPSELSVPVWHWKGGFV